MQKTVAVDSIVMQVNNDDGDLLSAQRLALVMGGTLEIIKNSPVRPTSSQKRFWKQIMGRNIPAQAVFIALIHHARGQAIPLMRHSRGRGLEIHFHGLQQYAKDAPVLNDGAVQRKAIFDEFLNKWEEPVRLCRFDYCIDHIGQKWCKYTNSRDHRCLSNRLCTTKFKKTTFYYQPPRATYVKITAYDKQYANKLSYPITRVEYSFKGQYWRTEDALKPLEIIEFATKKSEVFIHKIYAKKIAKQQ
jgi:hypothetical protein